MTRLGLSLTLLAGGCDRLQQAIEDKVQESVDDVAEKAAGDPLEDELGSPQEQLSAKLDLYVVCLARSEGRIRDSWERYVDYIKVDTGTPRRRGSKPFIYEIDDELAPCIEAARRGPESQPSLPEIEGAMSEYLTAAQAFAGFSADLREYYDNEGYTKDDWAKGKEVAADFAAAHERWTQAAAALTAAVDVRKDECDLEMLALIEERDGRKLQYLSSRYIIDARGLARCLEADNADASSCEEAAQTASQTFGAFAQYHSGNEAESESVFWMSAFDGAARSFDSESVAYMELLRKKKARPASLSKVSRAYTDLVGASNKLRFDFP